MGMAGVEAEVEIEDGAGHGKGDGHRAMGQRVSIRRAWR